MLRHSMECKTVNKRIKPCGHTKDPWDLRRDKDHSISGSRGSCFQDHGRHAGINLMRNIHQRWETREIP